MAQNIYDDSAFFAGYSQIPRQLHGLAGAPEWPAIRALLPDLVGKRVADLGCGFGWASRFMRQQGAASVLGLDLSHNMLARARADTADPAIEYRIADLEVLELDEGRYDLVYSALAFHYICDFRRLVRMMHRALAAGGDLVFTIEHPIYMAAAHPDWIVDAEGCRSWPVDGYAREGERRTDWIAPGVLKYHRMLGTTLNTLLASGFALRQVVETVPAQEQIAQSPGLADEIERPMILLIAAQKPQV